MAKLGNQQEMRTAALATIFAAVSHGENVAAFSPLPFRSGDEPLFACGGAGRVADVAFA
jgi:hypothetical protein